MENQLEEKDYSWLYYVLGLVFGILTGAVVEGQVLIGAALGLLTALFYHKVIAKRSEKSA